MKTNYLHQKKTGIQHVLNRLILLFMLLLPWVTMAQQTYTFTNCGATGSLGPTQTMVNTSYTLTNLSGSVGTTSTGIQTWTVPTTGLYRVTAVGASSGWNGNTARTPGYGATMAGNFSLNAGDVLQILVGQMGENHPSYAAGGGGGSFVTKTPHNTLASILVIAGGGGAPSGDFSGLSAVTATCGTFDVQSGPASCGGAGGITFTGNSGGGGGGFFSDGASNTTVANGGLAYVNGGAGAPTNLLYARGGFGGGGGNASPATSTYASNAGGGFSGGNGGNRNSTSGTGRMGGGGGGSYNNGSNQLNSVNTSTGHGLVLIQELCNISLNSSVSGSLAPFICSGTTLTLTTNAVSNYSWSNGSTASSIVVTPTITTVYSLAATSASNCVATRIVTVTVSSGLPTLSINTGTNVICAGQTLSFTASGANTYTWSNGIINGSTFSPTATAGYTVLGQNGCGTSSAVTTITVAPLPVSLISSPTVVCAGSTSTLSAAAAATSYTWFPVSTNAASIVVSPIANSVYTVVVSNGTCLGAATVAVNANPVPTIVASPTLASICAGDQLVMTATGANSYTWTPGNLSGNSVTVSPNVPTPYQVAGTNSFGCSSAANLAVIVMPSPSLSVLTDANLICAGSVVNMTVSGANSYTWNGGTTSNTISVNPNNTTSYTVTGEVSGCLSNTVINISVVNPSVSIAGNTSICAGESSTLTASGATSYSWNTGAIGSNAVVTPSGTSIYTVFASTNSISVNCPSTKTISVNVKPLPVVVASVSNSNICKGDNCVLSASGAGTYTWNTGATNASITVNHTLLTTVIYTVTGTSTLNCNNTGTVQVKVNACIGIENQSLFANNLQVFPNPSIGNVTIQASSTGVITILNELGQMVAEFNLNAENGYRNIISNLKSGIYFVIWSNNATHSTQKIIVTN